MMYKPTRLFQLSFPVLNYGKDHTYAEFKCITRPVVNFKVLHSREKMQSHWGDLSSMIITIWFG